MAEHVTVFSTAFSWTRKPSRPRGFGRPMYGRPRYALELGERATLVPTREGRVYGTVMTLKHQDVDRLYSEPSVAAYRPEPVLAQLMDGTVEPALCFNLPMQQGSSSNAEYAIALQAMARKMGLPDDYVAALAPEA